MVERPLCAICGKRRPERFCPAKGEKICAPCCGKEREVTLDCPSDCAYLISAHVLCRWSTLPLSYYLPAARESEGQGARIAKLTSASSLIIGSVFTIVTVVVALRKAAIAPVLSAIAIPLLSSFFYMRKFGGITGDCFGATNQLTEIAVYLCGVWTP